MNDLIKQYLKLIVSIYEIVTQIFIQKGICTTNFTEFMCKVMCSTTS